jgi:hypothetical protein
MRRMNSLEAVRPHGLVKRAMMGTRARVEKVSAKAPPGAWKTSKAPASCLSKPPRRVIFDEYSRFTL